MSTTPLVPAMAFSLTKRALLRTAYDSVSYCTSARADLDHGEHDEQQQRHGEDELDCGQAPRSRCTAKFRPTRLAWVSHESSLFGSLCRTIL